MSIACPSCFYDNPDGSVSCLRCGRAFATESTQQLRGGQQAQQGFYQTGSPGGQQAQQQFQQPTYTTPVAPAPPPYSPAPYSSTGAPTSSMGSLRRAFAGHGSLINHQSWLLDGKQAQVMAVRQTIFDKLVQRNLNSTQVSTVNLTDQGLMDERRDYVMIRRKSTSVFIYATPAGHDLYISRATTVQPGISLGRVAILCLGLLGIIIPWANVAASAANMNLGPFGGGGAAIAGLLFWGAIWLFLSLPLLWAFIVALARSFVYLALEKDFWVLLRPNTLTEFQYDEVALMEHTTDNVAREALKQLGLDADKITAPPNGYRPSGRVRLI